MLIVISLAVLSACGDSNSEDEIDTIVLADAGWDSIRIHNSIVQRIIEEGYDYDTEVIMGSTQMTLQGFRDGEINVYTEIWKENVIEIYNEALEAGDIEIVSTNFDDNEQGLYVPTYVIEGDPERGIEPMAPDLRRVEDLKDYPDVFEDPEDPGRGRILNTYVGTEAALVIDKKFESYGLDETMNNFSPGSDAAAVADLIRAYNAGEAWVGYYWSPTFVTAQLDLTLLEEDPYDEEIYEESAKTAFPPNNVEVGVHKDLPKQAPEVVEFLSNYETSSELTEAALLYMEENDADPDETALWWLNEYTDLWTNWVPEDVAERVMDSL